MRYFLRGSEEGTLAGNRKKRTLGVQPFDVATSGDIKQSMDAKSLERISGDINCLVIMTNKRE
jgi:hypothetical protein